MSEDKPGVGQFFAYLREKRSLWLIAAALVLGVCLMLFGGMDSEAEPVSAAVSGETADVSALEARVRTLCERVTGSADASVMITLETYGERQYAADVQVSLDGDRREQRTEFVTVSQGLIPTAEVTPEVRGVAIVCRGGDDAGIQLKLTNLVCALFGIPASAVSVVGAAG